MFCVILVFLLVAPEKAAPMSEVELHNELFNEKYNELVLPVRNMDDTVTVFVDFSVQAIEDLDAKHQTFSVSGYLDLSWVNQFLVWNPRNYSGVYEILVKCENIWLPDLLVANLIGDPMDLRPKNKNALLKSTGETVYWIYKFITVACKIRIRYFPFDSQSCDLELQSWWYPSSKLNLTSEASEETISLFLFKESSEWVLESIRVERYEKPEGWGHIRFIFNVRRRHLFHVFNLVLPLVCISLLNLTVFLLPAESGEKITLCISVFLTFAVFLTIITNSFPESSDEISLLSIYVTLQLVYSGTTTFATVFSLRLFYRDRKEHISWAYQQLCRLNCQPVVFNESKCHQTTGKTTPTDDDKQPSNKEPNASFGDVSWISVSRAFDRLCVLLSLVWNVILVIALVIAFLN